MCRRKRGLTALVCVSLSACIAQPAGQEEVAGTGLPLDEQSFLPGRGYLSTADQAVGDCLVPLEYSAATNSPLSITPVRPANVGGQEVVFSLSKVESSEDLQKKLNISASASGSFLVGSASAKFSFAEETKTSSTSVTLLASVVVRNTSWTMPPGVKFHPDAEALIKAGDSVRFRQRCGDGFIHSYTTGGEFYATIQVQTNSAEERQRISSSIKGSYLTISGSADFNKEMESIVKNSSTTVFSYQKGGKDGDAAPCRTVACVAERVAGFTTAVAKDPQTIGAQISTYDVLARPNDKLSFLDVKTALDTMRDINTRRNVTRDRIFELLDVQSRPDVYALGAPNATLAQVTTAIGNLNKNLTAYNDALKECVRDYAVCKVPTGVSVIALRTPPTKSAPGYVMLRPYNEPGEFLHDNFAMLSPCNGNVWAGTSGVADRSEVDAASLKLVPGVSGVAKSVSFQSMLEPSKVLTAWFGPSCNKRVKFLTSSSADDREKATFIRVPGLNGQPNTVSFRLHHITSAPVAGVYRNHDPNTYLSLSRISPISVQTQPDPTDAAAMQAFKDQVSWYVDQL